MEGFSILQRESIYDSYRFIYMNAPYCGVLDYRLFWMKPRNNLFGMLGIQNAILSLR